ncbi:MAG: CDP-alcohol phosphatidyltransferase family protein [Candidatus Heimdallarchaeota archaeon]|nr:CDP-alcohol phosphatidyltransferase family protein [Candidatus Heimdallarchaeota archaeon]
MTLISSIDNIGHKMISIGKFQFDLYAILANFSTISNFLLGLYAFIAVLFPEYVFNGHYLPIRAVVLGASFDAIDGKLARRSNTRPKLGAQFDTSADLVTFGFAPAAMILSMFYAVSQVGGLLLAGIYLFCASFRLSRFMIDPTTYRGGYFRGMASPPAAIFVAGWFALSNPNLILAAISLMFVAGLMITSFPFTAMKLVKTWFQKINFVFTISIMLLFTYAPDTWMENLGLIWIANVSYYGIFGPYHANQTLNLD